MQNEKSETMWVEIIEGDETKGIGPLKNNSVGFDLKFSSLDGELFCVGQRLQSQNRCFTP